MKLYIKASKRPWLLQRLHCMGCMRRVQALNDLFEKLLQRDVPARYLLRLGQGEQDLAAQGDFSRVGRVNAMLARRLTLLAEVGTAALTFFFGPVAGT